ncbi:TIGR02678 family protein [Brevibacillus sp. NPDC058079]|uniref:TIGR02678 family protein n=1 Tax=Brevibacillus sp. NPDC058079 TaxID=3346330 RepID=UPI0036F12847
MSEAYHKAVTLLLEQYILERKYYPEEYRTILRYERKIRKFFSENFGYKFFVGTESVKLEKVPATVKGWMGFQDELKSPLDYMYLMAVFSYLENKTPEEMFLIGELAEEVREFLKGKSDDEEIYDVDWKNRSQRLSFVWALKLCQNLDLVKLLDGSEDDFKDSEDARVLYRSTDLIKYYSRALSNPIAEYLHYEDLLQDGLSKDEIKHSLMRKLYFQPVLYIDDLTENEKKYISERGQAERIEQLIEENTLFYLERYRDVWLLVSENTYNFVHQFPKTQISSEGIAVLHLATIVKEEVSQGSLLKGSYVLELSYSQYEEILLKTKERFSLGWSNKLNQLTLRSLGELLLGFMEEWELAQFNKETYQVKLYSPLVRRTGRYSKEVDEGLKEAKEEDYGHGE